MKLKNKRNKKNIDLFLIICLVPIFLFISISLSIIDRNYFFLESFFKNANYLIINKTSNKKENKNDSNVYKVYIKELENENNELRKILKLKKNNKKITLCEVVNKHNIITKKTVEIKCSNKLKINSYVFNSNGLVGYVSKTSKKISEVKLLTNLDKPISVIIKSNENEIFGVLDNYDKKNNLFIVSNVISKNEIKINDNVMLYDNKNIKIGNVSKIKNSNYGISKKVIVKSDVNFYNLNFLYQIGD